MDLRRLLPYVLGLVFLAFALGTLPQGQSGTSLLFNSYWILYVLYFVPVIALVALVVLVAIIAYNWRTLSEGLGHGMARTRKMKPRRSKKSFWISLFFWGIAIMVLFSRQSALAAANQNSALKVDITGASTNAPDPTGLQLFASGLGSITSFVRAEWFTLVFTALLVVCGFVLVQSYRVSLSEPSVVTAIALEHRTQSLHAVHEAIKIVDSSKLDPRSRIIACYQQLVNAAIHLGACVSSNQTARELEDGIRAMFMLKGNAIHELTNLFEEARYSLHELNEEDASKAMEYLELVSQELITGINVDYRSIDIKP